MATEQTGTETREEKVQAAREELATISRNVTVALGIFAILMMVLSIVINAKEAKGKED